MLRSLKKKAAKGGVGRTRLAKGLLKRWQDGAVKLYVTFLALNYRKEHLTLFGEGEYVPLEVDGSSRENVCAFARLKRAEAAVVLVPRFLTRLLRDPFGGPLRKESSP